jgi:hypothetical protein
LRVVREMMVTSPVRAERSHPLAFVLDMT